MQAENSLNRYVTATFYRKLRGLTSVLYNFSQQPRHEHGPEPDNPQCLISHPIPLWLNILSQFKLKFLK